MDSGTLRLSGVNFLAPSLLITNGRLSSRQWSIPYLPSRLCHNAVKQPRAVSAINFDVDFEYSFENGQSSFLPSAKPDPIQFPRKSLNLKFAVLLMRSSYQACDDLNFIAMDKFQAKFWKLRQSEVEPYTLQYSPIRIRAGDLTDPLYFDFINFAQYATISEAMRTGEVIFQERNGAYGEVVTVQRDPNLKDNRLLPPKFKDIVGKKIYQGLVDGFEDTQFGAPPPCPAAAASTDCLIEGVNSLLKVMVQQGYALSANLYDVEGPGSDSEWTVKVTLRGPASLWGIRELASRRALVLNDYEAMIISSFLRESGYSCSYKSKFTDTSTAHVFKFRRQ